MTMHLTCDGMRRRDFLRVGALGTAGLTLGSYLRAAETGRVNPQARAKAAIFVNLPGGPAHTDMFDMKPNAPDTHRGEFSPIGTRVPGIQISEHLPRLAGMVDKYTIVRNITHTLAAHRLGSEYINTGNTPLPSLEFPGYGAVVAKELGGPDDLPPFVAIPNTTQRAGYLGVQYAPLHTNSTPRPGEEFSVRGLTLGEGLTIADVNRRQNLLGRLDTAFTGFEKQNQLLEGMDRFSQQAYAMITSPRTRQAFDVSRERPAYATKFGITPFGQSCLLATRLVEAGVPFVTVSYGGWDTHQDNWTRLRDQLLPPFDEGLAALFQGLSEKGLLDSTVVFVTGEFGRTPRISQRGGRDHHARAMFMLMAGAGMSGGRVIGETDELGEMPVGRSYSPDDMAATFYHTLGIDHRAEYETNTGRPVMIVREGSIIEELLA